MATDNLHDQAMRPAGGVALWTLVSRILGFARDMILAVVLGASGTSDAFYVAFRVPNMLRDLLAEGSMSAAFVPVFKSSLAHQSRSYAHRLASETFSVLVITLFLIVALGIIFSHQIVQVLASGFTSEQLQLTASLTQIIFPFLLFISLSALAMGVLNSVGRFGPPAYSSVAFNAINMAVTLALLPILPASYAAALGVTLGGFAQAAVQWPALRSEGFTLRIKRPTWPLHPDVLTMGTLMLPTILALSATQINLFVNTVLASHLPPGSVSYLYYSMRLFHFPMGIFAIALSSTLLPTLSEQAARGSLKELGETCASGLRMVFFLVIPAAVGLIFLRVPIVHLLFEHGRFDAGDTLATADALVYYALGLPAASGTRIVVQAFYAMQDTKTPVKVSFAAVLVNVVMGVVLMSPMRHRGLALAAALSMAFNFFVLVFLLRRRAHALEGRRTLHASFHVVLASSGVALFCVGVNALSLWQVPGAWSLKAATLGLAMLLAVVIYGLTHALLKSEGYLFFSRFLESLRHRFLR